MGNRVRLLDYIKKTATVLVTCLTNSLVIERLPRSVLSIDFVFFCKKLALEPHTPCYRRVPQSVTFENGNTAGNGVKIRRYLFQDFFGRACGGRLRTPFICNSGRPEL